MQKFRRADRLHGPLRALFLGAATLLSGSGCDPIRPEDRQFFEGRDLERGKQEALLRSASEKYTEEDLVLHVRNAKAPDGTGTMDDWLNRTFISWQGQVMFPRWSATRRGSNKQEIIFDFVLIDASNTMNRLAFSWELDVLNMTVGPATLVQLEQASSPDQAMLQKQERRVREHEKQLE